VGALLALILLPLLAALALLAVKGRTGRAAIVIAASALAAAGSLSLVFTHFPLTDTLFHLGPGAADTVVLVMEVALSALVFAIALRRRRPLIAVLAVLQAAVSLVGGLAFDSAGLVEHAIAADKLSVIMAVIVGVVGGLIAVYSLGYMEAWHAHHREVRDRRRLFFFLQFLFLSAMFGILFSNSLPLLHLFWEVTTLCSFLLIGYDGTGQSRDRASLALVLNMLGGLAFSGAILVLAASSLPLGIDALVNAGAASTMGRAGTVGGIARSAALLPAVLLSFAGLTKSAQMPFSSWLLGAMSAPTPVSALLHSATMVKAGVYLVVRLAPILQGSLPGVMIALVGGITFLLGSLAAVSQRDAKRVLAWSTIANLGLIVMCAGIGTYESVWAAILLILFHAVTKALMFLTVGTVEQTTGSRDIEDMSGLILTMPRLSIMMQVGIAGMFIAPFGMLVSKWAVLRALVDYNPLLAVFVVFGSSATVFFWVKWLGKLVEVSGPRPTVESGISVREWVSMGALSALTVALCALYPVASARLIEPYVVAVYGTAEAMSQGNIIIMSIMLGLVALFPLTFFVYGRRVKVVDPYLGGANVAADFRFQAAAGEEKSMRMANYYLLRAFGERRLSTVGMIVCGALVLVAIGVAL
jgi:ech hydrogenase subunit A